MSGRRRLSWLATKLGRLNPYFGSLLATALFLGFALALPERTGRWSASVILLLAALASASLWGLRQGLIVSFIVALAYDFFFLPPLYTLAIDDPQHVLSLLILGLGAAAVSLLAEILSRRTHTARRNEILAKQAYSLGQRLREEDGIAAIAQNAVASVGAAVGAKAILLLPDERGLTVAAAHPAGRLLSRAELEAAKYACEHNLRRIGEPDANPGLTCTRLYVDEALENDAILIVGETTRRFWELPQRMRVIDMLAGPASSALKRVTLARRAKDAWIAAETEKMRVALLTSISHDLKTPLAIMLGSASSLLNLGADLGEEAEQHLLYSIVEEGERLNQFIANLFDMSRVESHALKPKRQISDLSDIIGSALRRAARTLSKHRVAVHVPADIPTVELDPVLMETVFFNILENAAKYTPAGTEITLTVFREADFVVIQIRDEGPGIAPQELPKLFEKFYRGGGDILKPAGTGLGLAISRGFLEAMGGAIIATNRRDRSGAEFTIRLPATLTKARRHQQRKPVRMAS